MTTVHEFDRYGEELERLLRLRTSPILPSLVRLLRRVRHGDRELYDCPAPLRGMRARPSLPR